MLLNNKDFELAYFIARREEYKESIPGFKDLSQEEQWDGNDSNLLIVFYVQIMPDDFVMQLHRF